MSNYKTRAAKDESSTSNRICRTCMLLIDENSDWISITDEVTGFTEENDKFLIMDELCSINVGMEDHELLPKRICKSCVDLLKSVHAFRILVQTSQSILKMKFGIADQEPEIKKIKLENENSSSEHNCEYVEVVEPYIKNNAIDNVPEHEEFFNDDLERKYDCWYCEEIFVTSNELEEHEKNHIEEEEMNVDISDSDNIYSYELIDFSIEENPSDLDSNDSIEDDDDDDCNIERKYECFYCDETFDNAKDLQTHEKCHEEETPLKCPKCKKCCKFSYDFEIHLKSHRNKSNNDIYLCERCGIADKKRRAFGHFNGRYCIKSREITQDDDKIESSHSKILRGKRKRERNTHLWAQNMRKSLRQSGKEYVNINGNMMPKRELKPPCNKNCMYSCSSNFPKEIRQIIHKNFWSLDDENKTLFLTEFVCKENCKKRRGSNKKNQNESSTYKRKGTFLYHFKKDNKLIRVCKTFFLNTLDISDRRVYYYFNTINSGTNEIKVLSRRKNCGRKPLHKNKNNENIISYKK